ncbi:MAG TPA: hypothetical protein VGH54_10325 [Mycobacterium sp.]|jgi:hypothetical protein|uniref:hypothetical protein n=1 Tax=Mycobacterium sp. TaxID=1785 RepID=UPI002F422B32
MKSSDNFPVIDLALTPVNEATEHRAALAVCSMATNTDDARTVLEALGLVAPAAKARAGRRRNRYARCSA